MIVLTALAAAAALLLVWAGADHVREPAALVRAFAGRRLLATGLAAAEIAVGASALAAIATPLRSGRWALAGQAVLYLGFLAYLAIRYRNRDRADCACARVGARIGVAGLVRTGALGLISAAAAAGYPAATLPTLTPADPQVLLGLAAATALGVLAYTLPPAIDGPSRGIPERSQA
jgi:methylamine utilization protein MauE